MKATLHKLIGTAVLGLALCSHSVPAWAGAATRNEVYISPSRTSAQGSLTGARYSADSQQYIGCNALSPSSSHLYQLVGCSARDKRGRSLICFSTDARIADAVKAMTDSSHIYIRGTNNGACSDLEVSNESTYLR
jgi:hypothetical protein